MLKDLLSGKVAARIIEESPGFFETIRLKVNSVNWEGIVFVGQILSVILSIGLLVAIVLLIIALSNNNRESQLKSQQAITKQGFSRAAINQDWQKILDKLETKKEDNYKFAIIEADKMLDNLLRKLGYQGQTMAEKLKQLDPGDVSALEGVWFGHKLRNKIAHQPDIRVTYNDAKSAIEAFESAFRDLGALN